MERGTFPKIREAFDDFVVARLRTSGDEQSAFHSKLQVRLVAKSQLPHYLVVDPETEAVLRDWGFDIRFKSDPSTFARLLDEGHAVYKDRKGN